MVTIRGRVAPAKDQSGRGSGDHPSDAPTPQPPPSRVEGFLPLAGYGVLGDGRTVALVGADGRLDWWPCPTLDAPPLLAAVVDVDDGGHFSLAPQGPFRCVRRYLPATNVLETTYVTDSGTAVVTDALNSGSAGRLPWSELVRRVEGRDGRVAMSWSLRPGTRFGQAEPWVERAGAVVVAAVGDQSLALVHDRAGEPEVSPHGAEATFTVGEGERAVLGVVVTDGEPLFLPPVGEIDARLDRTVASWHRWSELLQPAGPWSGPVHRSALALKTLLAEESGAIAAAATTSLPERIGGPKNWDYRYAWIRDSSFAVDALMNLELSEEVHGAVSWLLSAVRNHPDHLHIFYKLDGSISQGTAEVDVSGYRGSRPVRFGNSASGQLQLGIYGDFFDSIHRYAQAGHLLDRGTGTLLADLADHCCDRWRSKDSGIWELDQLEHYTISKIGCWVALDRAARLAEVGQIPARRAERWRTEAEGIRQWVNERCWSERRRCYTFYADTDDLDAAVLLAGRTGFERGDRLADTIEAVRAGLGQGALLYRYSGMDQEEGAFVACTFWMVEALVHTGQLEKASALMEEALAFTNDLGLLSEQIDPESGEFLGNIPQGLSHLALINAASTYAKAVGR